MTNTLTFEFMADMDLSNPRVTNNAARVLLDDKELPEYLYKNEAVLNKISGNLKEISKNTKEILDYLKNIVPIVENDEQG
jgi:hypothetical protein